MVREKMNILFCLDDIGGNYTRHCAVTLLSLLETNKKNRIKIWVMASILPKENIDELKRIVLLYNQEIEFIIRDDIIPEELKKVIINKNSLTRGVWYRWFFPGFINGVDRILYMDCDVLVMDDISSIYNMDMHKKTIAGYYDIWPFRCKTNVFGVEYYINAGVLLFDAKKYDARKISVEKMNEINSKYSKYFHGSDQDKANIIFKDDIFTYKQEMNYQITSKFFNKGLCDAKIVHCLSKPYVQYNNVPTQLVKLYYHYLNLTKRKGYPEEKANYGYFKHIVMRIRNFCSNGLIRLLGDKIIGKIFGPIYKILWDIDYKMISRK